MKRAAVGLLLLAVLAQMLACSASRSAVQTRPVEIDGERLILGETTYEAILKHFPRWQRADRFAPIDSAAVAALEQIQEDYQIYCFLGTWCSDSRRGVPPFVRTLQLANNPHLHLHLIGVDRSKRKPEPLPEQFGIQRVPTFVILKNGQEVGRMVEYPSTTFVQDFLQIIAQAH